MNSVDQELFPVFMLFFILFNLSYAFAGSVDDIHVLKISARDERAIIRTLNGKMQIIKPGDHLGTSGKITEIAADRIVIEEKRGIEAEKVIVRLIDGKQNVERLRKIVEQSASLLAPAENDKKTKILDKSLN